MNRLQLQGGIRTEVRGLEAAATASAFMGRLDHDAHVARGSVLQAEVPAYGQACDGWRIGLRLAPSSWLKGGDGLRWRPVVNVSTQRLHGGSGTVPDVYREVRSGVPGFTGPARMADISRTVHGIRTGITARTVRGGRIGLGLTGMMVDGAPKAALAAVYRKSF